MRIKDIMTKQIACVDANDTVEKAAQLMKKYNVGSVPVCEDEKVIGILTDRDIALRYVAEGRSAGQTVSGIMTNDPVVGTQDMDAREAADVMGQRQIRRLPIVEQGTLVGIVALGDISTQPELQVKAESALKDISQPAGMT